MKKQEKGIIRSGNEVVYQLNVNYLKQMVRARELIQANRITLDNRIGRKADGGQMKTGLKELSAIDLGFINSQAQLFRKQEDDIEKELKKTLKRFDVWNKYLKNVGGIGPITAAWIISEIKIERADTVSKITQFIGVNPTLIKGKKAVLKKKYKKEMGEIAYDLPLDKEGNKKVAVITDTLIRGDKKKEGFLSPFNGRLKAVLLGILADSFIKSQAKFATDFYYSYKTRLENSELLVQETQKGGKVVEIMWKDATKQHRHQAAKRYMIKHFIMELYANWRKIEGLPVRKPYEEEYLGRKHSGKKEIKIKKRVSVK